MNRFSFILLSVLFFSGGCSEKDELIWISSTADNPWQSNTNVYLGQDVNIKTVSVPVNSPIQVIDGFGGCFNELGWEAMKSLPENEMKKVLISLFDPKDGTRFNIFRLPIGANDYAVNWYSLDESAGDIEMKNFSLDRDRKRLIPYIKSAQAFNPTLKIWASPWCPPSWMKTNNHYACSSNPEVNDLPAENQGEEMVTQFRMEPEILKAYALYFRKFIEGYKEEGIDIYAVHVQNEMNSCQNFPSCIWRPEDLGEFIGQYLGSEFESSGLNTEIWYGTVERPQIERVDSVLLNPETSRYIRGMGFQWAGKDLIPKIRRKYPDLKLMQTETECGFGSNDWAAAEYTFNLIKHYLKNGASAYMYWNMVLDETGKSQWGWKQNSMIIIDRATGKISYNPEYYLMKHFSYFVEPGSRFVYVPDDENCLAFIKENDVVIFYFNKEDNEVQKNFSANEFTMQIVLKPHSFNTFKFRI